MADEAGYLLGRRCIDELLALLCSWDESLAQLDRQHAGSTTREHLADILVKVEPLFRLNQVRLVEEAARQTGRKIDARPQGSPGTGGTSGGPPKKHHMG